MRVLMTLDGEGGVLTYAHVLIEGLTGAGVEVAGVCFGRRLSHVQRAALAAAGLESLQDTGLALEWMENPAEDLERARDCLGELVASWRPDLVHANCYLPGTLASDVPVLVVAHSCVASWWRAVHGVPAPPSWEGYRGLVSDAMSGASAIVAPTQAMADALEREYAHGRAVSVIPNASAAPQRPAGEPRAAAVLAAGRLWDEAKNLSVLELAAERMHHPMLLAGEVRPGTGGGSGTAVMTAAGAAQRLGPLSPDALGHLRRQVRVFAAPARYEPFGLAILEAARSGCALLLGDIPSLRELWDGAARFVDPADPEALAAAADALAGDSAASAAWGGRAFTRAGRYGSAEMTRAYLSLYRSLLRAPERMLT